MTFYIKLNNLADIFIQSDLQMRRAIEALKPTIGQQYVIALTSPSAVHIACFLCIFYFFYVSRMV